jgi:LacI family transcriptional regulator
MNLEDIAAKAGVSRSTVSRVINNAPHVSEKTRERVRRVIEAEGFSPNPAARMLVTQRTRTIGIVIPQSLAVVFEDAHYYPTLLGGVVTIANERDYAMLFWMEESGAEEDRFYQRILRNRWMDGLLIASAPRRFPFVERLLELGVPIVTVERPDGFEDQVSFVTVENTEASAEAVLHLALLGRRRIATILGDMTNFDAVERLEGYLLGLQRAGLPHDPSLIAEGHFSRRAGREATRQLLAHHPDAIFCASDQMAIGAMEVIVEAGLRIPQDIAIIGFDDLPHDRGHLPNLSTIRVPIRDRGVQAATLLLDQIEGREIGPRHAVLPTQLIIRETCGAAETMSPG